MLPHLQLLRDARLRAIWLAELLNAFGSGLTFWGLAWLLYRAAPGGALLAAEVLTVLSLATPLGSLLLGAQLDHWNRRRVLVACNAALALLTALLPLAAWWGLDTGSALPLLLLVSAAGLLRGLPGPALGATLPALVPGERLLGAQSLFALTWIPGELLAAAGSAPLTPSLRTWWTRFREGWRFVLARPALWGLLLGAGAANGYFGSFGALLLPRVGERLAGASGPVLVGLLDTATLSLELLGTLWLGSRTWAERRARPLLLLAFTGAVLTGLALMYAPGVGAAFLFAALNGLTFAPVSALLGLMVARSTPSELLGRVSSVRAFLGTVPRPAALLLVLLGAVAVWRDARPAIRAVR